MRYFIFCLCFLPLLLPLLSVYNIQPTLSLPLSNSSIHLCHQQDSAALLQFVRNFAINSSASAYCADIYRHQPAYPKTRSWNHNTDCCSWDGVSCDSLSGHVIELDLTCSQIQGTIDSNSTLFQLQTLQSLNLASNDFNNSTISPKFGHFPHLKHLNLSYTTFSGKVPVEIARLSHLISLEISSYYTLEMPDLGLIIKNMTNLKELILDDVYVSSVMPRSLLNLTSLTSLTLTGCDLHGNFPTDILHLPHLRNLDIEEDNLHANFSGFWWTNPLEVLTLSSWNFTEKLPEPARPAQYPRILSLSACNFNGFIPSWVFSETEEVYLSQNQLSGELPSLLNKNKLPRKTTIDLSDNILSGKIPSWVWNVIGDIILLLNRFSGELPSLLNTNKLPRKTTINLYDNMLSGKIPSWFWNVTGDVYLSSNQFSGELPSLLNTNKLPRKTTINLSDNMLSGKIPSWFWNVTGDIDLSSNQFSGELPSLLNTNKLPRKTSIDLSDNMLSGKIPSWFWNVTGDIDLFSNKFSGELPSLLNTNKLPRITSIDLSQNNLSGKIPSWIFTLPLLEILDLSKNEFSGQLIIDNYVNVSSSLITLDLSSNNLSGTIDLSMFHKLESLSDLSFSKNNLSLSFNTIETSTVWHQFTRLGLSSCNLGKFPYFLINQENLQVLELSNNRIHCQVPHWMLLKNKFSALDISYNYLTSRLENIPWNNLEYIDFRSNMFSGPLVQLPPSIKVYLVSNNNFTGEIPSTICNFTSLQLLDLSNNSLTGQIPQCLGNISDDLTVLNLKLNKFHGTLPQDFTKCGFLAYLNVNNNQLGGPVPTSLTNCSSLQVLDLGNNKLNGKFPHWLGTLPDLQVLVLHSNRFKGLETEVDYSQTLFPRLQILDISNNQFSGNFPQKLIKSFKAMMDTNEEREKMQYMSEYISYAYAAKKYVYRKDTNYMFSISLTFKGIDHMLDRVISVVTAIDVSGNRFGGDIPDEIADLVSLRWLNLSYNQFSGTIPPSLGNLVLLESLDFSSNELVGQIPKELENLKSLEVFNVSRNNLAGPIPTGAQFNTFGNESYLENPRLCGQLLLKNCGDDDVNDAVEAPSMVYHDSKDISVWEIDFIGYGSGMVMGLSIGYLVICGRTPLWLSRLICRVKYIMEHYSKGHQRRFVR